MQYLKIGLTATALLTVVACSDPVQPAAELDALGSVPSMSEVTRTQVLDLRATNVLRRQRSHASGGSPFVVADRATFEASGVVVATEDFESSGPVGFEFPGNPYVTGGVSYNSLPANLIIGPLQPVFPVTSNVICNSFWTPVDATVIGVGPDPVDMLAFDVTVLGRLDLIRIEIHTTGGTHVFTDVDVPGAPDDHFFGFKAPAGEQVTGFELHSDDEGSAPCLDNVTLAVSAGITLTLANPGAVNVRSKGVIPITVLSDADFDATTLDASTATFGPGAATEVHGTGHVEDVDGDGDLDMVFHFAVQDTGISCGDTEADLTVSTTDGQTVQGTATFKTTGCKGGD